MSKLDKIDEVNSRREHFEWNYACEYAEENIEALHHFLETWGPHCGAPREVFRGHLVKMLLDSTID